MLFWSDTISACIVSIIRLKFELCNEFTFSKCLGIVSMTRAFSYVSIGCLLFITFERYLKLIYNKIYYQYINKTYVIRGLICHLILSLIMGIIVDNDWKSFANNNNNEIIKYCTYGTVLNPTYGFLNSLFVQIFTILIIITLYIFIILFVKNKTISTLENQQSRTPIRRNLSKYRKARKIKAEFKIAISAMAIVGCYCLFVFPIIFIDLIKFSTKISKTQDIYIPSNISLYAICCGILYPAIEGIVFLITSQQFWKPIGIIFKIKPLINMITASAYTTSIAPRTYRNNSVFERATS